MGVGRLEDGQRVYFAVPEPPFGSMAEVAVAPASLCVPVPNDLDDVTAAALANPGQASWGALTERAMLQPGETVLINGATGISGRLAVQIAKYLGASKVIATGRSTEALERVQALGADVIIPLSTHESGLNRQLVEIFSEGVDIVLDFLWGRSAELILAAAVKGGAPGVPVRYVQIGSISGPDITLAGAILRASAIELMGSGIGSIPVDQFMQVTASLMDAARGEQLKIATAPVPLSEVGCAWSLDDNPRRTVFIVSSA